jgi:hypothetical protein
VTRPDKYPVPNMTDLASRLHGCKVFTKLDLSKGYYQILVRVEDIPKTAVITPFGLWEFLRMPFGLRNAGQTFQRLMDMVGAGLTFIFMYLDDVLVASPDEVSHVQHLAQVFQRLREFGLQLNIYKCSFGQPHVEFLGHHISERGAEPLLKHLEAVQAFLRLQDVKDLQGFLGLINFYQWFIPAAAKILLPLTSALKGGKKARLDWSQQMEDAFVAAKAALCEVVSLAQPDLTAAVSLACDASDTHVGAVLQQWSSKGWQLPSFYSKKLDESKKKYSTFDRELLAVYLAVRHFRFLLKGRSFHIETDHKLLPFALHRTSEPWSARQQRYLAEFTSDIRHVAGSQNMVADSLSRPPAGDVKVPSGSLPGLGPLQQLVAPVVCRPSEASVDLEAMARDQQACPETSTTL